MIKAILLTTILTLSSTFAFAQWQQTNGPNGGGSFGCFASSGSNIFAGSGGSVFLSTNNGSSWIAVNNGLTASRVLSLAISGINIFAGTNDGVFLSSNNGSNWTKVSNGLQVGTWVPSLAISGSNIFAATYVSVYLSSNNGNSWTAVNNGLGGTPYSLTISGTNIFAGTTNGVYLSSNNGSNWTAINNGMTRTTYSIAVSGANIFAGTNAGVYVSSDNGSSWTGLNTSLTSTVNSLAISGTNIFAGTIYGVYISSDSGNSWVKTGLQTMGIHSVAIHGTSIYAESYFGVFLSSDNGSNWVKAGVPNTNIQAIAIRDTTVIAGTPEGVFFSTDNGSSWTKRSTGFTDSNILSLAVSDTNIFAGTRGAKMFLSSNNGKTWTAVNTGMTPLYIYSIAISGTNIFAGTSGGIFLSTDNGSNWTAVNTGMTWDTYSLAISGTNIFAGAYTGMYLSSDNGNSWTAVNNGLKCLYVYSLAISGTSIFAGTDNGVFLSSDNGSSWTAFNTGLTNKDVRTLAISGANIFAGTYGGGVFLSNTNGSSWVEVNTGLTNSDVRSLVLNGANIFAGTYGGGVLKRPLNELHGIYIDPTTLKYTYNGNQSGISVYCDTAWTVTKDQSWISVNTLSGSGNDSFVVLVAENSSEAVRLGTVTVSAGAISQTVQVIQYSNSKLVSLWSKAIGGVRNEQGKSIVLDASANIYTSGFFQDTVDFDPGINAFNLQATGYQETFVSKLDASGNFELAKQLGGSVTGGSVGNSVTLDASGNIYTIGSFWGTVDFKPGPGVFNLTCKGESDIFISKLDPSGNFVWAKAMGGKKEDEGFDISVDASGNVYTTGRYYDTADFDPGVGVFNLTSLERRCIFVSKLDGSGNFVWAKAMYGNDAGGEGNSLALDANGNVYTTGYFYHTVDFDPGPGVYDLFSEGIFISKLDSSGNFVWAKGIGHSESDVGTSIVLDALGNIYTTGRFDSKYGTGSPTDFDPGPGVFNLTAVGESDIFILKLDASGNFVWAKAMGGANNESASSIAVDASGNVLITGYFNDSVDFDPGPGVFNLTSAGREDIFISNLDASGNLISATVYGGTNGDFGNSITLNASGNPYVTGCFYSPSITFGATTLTNNGIFNTSDLFIAKFATSALGIRNISASGNSTVSVYPNPSGGKFIVQLEDVRWLTADWKIEVYNMLGEKVYTSANIHEGKSIIDISNQAKGIYFVKVVTIAGTYNQKIVLQ